ncbi:hypothetical protein AUJ17_00705 [Candidatus Micrarchaeota archaeon CG1_02_47_40]|nr:MAG: hypothetical protein AUJ17_00705 [Candidatus Micrarchaeota archaeon CG1_02_47_40]
MHQLLNAFSFGLTSGVITALGMLVGLYSATSSRLAVVAGIIIMAIADGLADAAGMHLAEESEMENGKAKHTHNEVWVSTIFTFIAVGGSIITFAVPVLLLPLEEAIAVGILWGVLILVLFNYYSARMKREEPLKPIIEHLLLAAFVIIVSYFAGIFVGNLLG